MSSRTSENWIVLSGGQGLRDCVRAGVVGVDEVDVVGGQQLSDSGGGVNHDHLFGYSCGEHHRRAIFDPAQAPQRGRDLDRATMVNANGQCGGQRRVGCAGRWVRRRLGSQAVQVSISTRVPGSQPSSRSRNRPWTRPERSILVVDTSN